MLFNILNPLQAPDVTEKAATDLDMEADNFNFRDLGSDIMDRDVDKVTKF